jgi:hypothetical protein
MRVTSIFKGDDGCRDSACPAFIGLSDPELVGVQGTRLTDPEALASLEVPGHETVIVIPRSLAEAWKASGR